MTKNDKYKERKLEDTAGIIIEDFITIKDKENGQYHVKKRA